MLSRYSDGFSYIPTQCMPSKGHCLPWRPVLDCLTNQAFSATDDAWSGSKLFWLRSCKEFIATVSAAYHQAKGTKSKKEKPNSIDVIVELQNPTKPSNYDQLPAPRYPFTPLAYQSTKKLCCCLPGRKNP